MKTMFEFGIFVLVPILNYYYFESLPLAEQLYSGPGNSLIVYASETLGPPPVCMAWLITTSVSIFHHSPKTFFELKFVLLYIYG